MALDHTVNREGYLMHARPTEPDSTAPVTVKRDGLAGLVVSFAGEIFDEVVVKEMDVVVMSGCLVVEDDIVWVMTVMVVVMAEEKVVVMGLSLEVVLCGWRNWRCVI